VIKVDAINDRAVTEKNSVTALSVYAESLKSDKSISIAK